MLPQWSNFSHISLMDATYIKYKTEKCLFLPYRLTLILNDFTYFIKISNWKTFEKSVQKRLKILSENAKWQRKYKVHKQSTKLFYFKATIGS